MDSFLGLGSALVVPALAVAVGFTLTARDRLRRAWWFGVAVSAGICLPLCPFVQEGLHNVALHLQSLTQAGTLSLSQRVIEPVLLLAVLVVPLLAVCVVGALAGRVLQLLARSNASIEEPDLKEHRWRFSVRELLIGCAAVCLVLALIFGQSRRFQVVEEKNQNSFRARFLASFDSGQTKLLSEPTVNEQSAR